VMICLCGWRNLQKSFESHSPKSGGFLGL
jgi:hypothetical protein